MKKLLPFLSVAFSGFLVYLFDKIIGDSIDWNQLKSFKVLEILTRNIVVYQLLIFVLISTILILVGRRIFKGNAQYYNRKQRQLRKYNKSVIEELGILLRWNVYFDLDTPFIGDLTAFCTKHEGSPLRFMNNRCPMPDCPNNRNQYNEFGIKNAIESELIDRWDKMK